MVWVLSFSPIKTSISRHLGWTEAVSHLGLTECVNLTICPTGLWVTRYLFFSFFISISVPILAWLLFPKSSFLSKSSLFEGLFMFPWTCKVKHVTEKKKRSNHCLVKLIVAPPVFFFLFFLSSQHLRYTALSNRGKKTNIPVYVWSVNVR